MPGVENESTAQHQRAIWPVMVAIGVSVLFPREPSSGW